MHTNKQFRTFVTWTQVVVSAILVVQSFIADNKLTCTCMCISMCTMYVYTVGGSSLHRFKTPCICHCMTVSGVSRISGRGVFSERGI